MSGAIGTDEALLQIARLPRVDEHATTIDAGVDEVWRALLEALDAGFARAPASAYARLVGCHDHTSSGPRPLAEGSTLPGFRVVSARPGAELVLAGRHRFSSYALIFRLDEIGAHRSRLRAETRATFPGPAGAVYRLLVIGTGGHAVAVGRMLAKVQRRTSVPHSAAGRQTRFGPDRAVDGAERVEGERWVGCLPPEIPTRSRSSPSRKKLKRLWRRAQTDFGR